MSTVTTVHNTSCSIRNYDYYRRFFQLTSKTYYHNTNYFSNANVNANEKYYDKTILQAPVNITSRNNSTLCFPSPLQMKTNAIIGSSGDKLTKQQIIATALIAERFNLFFLNALYHVVVNIIMANVDA